MSDLLWKKTRLQSVWYDAGHGPPWMPFVSSLSPSGPRQTEAEFLIVASGGLFIVRHQWEEWEASDI